MKFKIKIQIIIISAVWYIIATAASVNAASLNISASKNTLNVGETATITISSDSIGSVDISTTGGTLSGTTPVWVEKNSQSGISITSNKAGKITITAKPTQGTLSNNYKDEEVSPKSVTVEFIDNSVKDEQSTQNTLPEENSTSNDKPVEVDKATNNENSNKEKDETSSKEQPKEITFKDTNETMYTSSRVNLRKKYGTDGEIYKTIPEGEELTRTGYSKTNVDGYSWSRVQYNGGTYYCITKSLTATKPEKNDDEKDTKVNETEKNETTVNETSENLTNEVTNQTTNEISQETVVKDQNGDLKKLEIPGYILSPLFKSNVYEYKLSVTDDVMDLDVKSEPANSNVQIEIAGNKDLKEGENIVTIMCYNKETKKNTTYQIIVEKKAKENIHAEAIREARQKRSLIIKAGIGLIIILIIACIIVFKKGREEQQEEYEQEKEEPKSLKEFKKESESKNEPVKSETYEKTSVEKEVTKVKEVKNEPENKDKIQKQREEEFDEKLQKIKSEKRKQQRGGKHF